MSPANKTLFILGLSSGSAGLLAQPLVEIEFMPRTLNQMSAFCEARGFQPATVELLSKQCFITIRIYNTGRQSIWLDLDNWRFSTNSKPLERLHCNQWKPIWADMETPPGEAVCFPLDTVTGKTRLSAG